MTDYSYNWELDDTGWVSRSPYHKVLLEEGDWCLVKMEFENKSSLSHLDGGDCSYVYLDHKCSPMRSWHQYWQFELPCPRCGELPPESLQGLWVMIAEQPNTGYVPTERQKQTFLREMKDSMPE